MFRSPEHAAIVDGFNPVTKSKDGAVEVEVAKKKGKAYMQRIQERGEDIDRWGNKKWSYNK